ncbi:MAG: LCP family protein [Lachnospiraceae bacterium]
MEKSPNIQNDNTQYEKIEATLGHAADEERKKRRRRRILHVTASWIFLIFLILLLLFGVVAVVRAMGEKSLRDKAEGRTPTITGDTIESISQIGQGEETAGMQWEEDWIRYQGDIYEYNDDILTFLVMGIDQDNETTDNKDLVSGGQADALFLTVVNPDDKTIRIIAVNRDTMTDVVMKGIGVNGEDLTAKAQIAVQHGFGDGREESCELTRQAVSALFYDLPIHGYAAVNMAAIPEINDAVGGVTVTIPQDMSELNPAWTEGTEITLKGMDSFRYLRWRDTTQFESARKRLERQKRYLSALVRTAIAETKKDMTLPVTLYGNLKKYMVTDITADEVTYLAGELIDYQFEGDNIYTLEGTTIMGAKYEEFYPDEEALQDLIIRIFYRKVDVQDP